jgi:class 3 adenylate cyclase
MKCPACRHDNPAENAFCGRCGTKLVRRCAACRRENPPDHAFCGGCGARLAGTAPGAAAPAPPRRAGAAPATYTPKHLAEKILGARAALEGERKRVTVLFADVKGSMELAEQLDPEEWHRILDRFFAILTEGVHRFEGTVNQYTGDGIMALFGAPIAHEDHAQRACYAALRIRDDVRRYANELRVAQGLSFGVRIGLNSGEVVVGKIGDDLRMDYTAQGLTVGLAQRMESLADSGRICLSEHTARLVEGYFALESLGRAAVKGVREPVGLHELEGVGPYRTRLDRSRARGLSTFVGREQEMALLEAALERTIEGHAGILGVVADAGVGKSRLCYEFVERCTARRIPVHQASCPSHGRSVPLLPIRELLRSYFAVGAGEEPQAAREKVAGRLLLLDRDLEPALPLVWELLNVGDPARPADGGPPEERHRRLLEVWRRASRVRGEREPAVVLIDDLHWVDPTSDLLLDGLIGSIHGTRTLVLVNFRPEYRAGWMERSDYQQIPLTPLGEDALAGLLAKTLGAYASLGDLARRIATRAAGNPFFAEELLQSLVETGRLEGTPGAYRLTAAVDTIEVPETVQAILAARIDALGETEKGVLQNAAVIGKTFELPLLAAMADLEENAAAAHARTLAAADFIYERALYPVTELAFRHPLTQEVAYGSQLQSRRREMHARLARLLETAAAEPALLAHHFDEADDVPAAIRWHRAAAERSGMLDPTETLRHGRRVGALLERLPPTPETLAARAHAAAQLLWTEIRSGIPLEEIDQRIARVREMAEASGDYGPLARAELTHASFLFFSGRPGLLPVVARAMENAERSGDRRMQIVTCWYGALMQSLHDVSASVEAASRGIELCGNDLDLGAEVLLYSPWMVLRVVRATSLASLGRFTEAFADLDEVFADHGEAYVLTQQTVRCFAGRVQIFYGDYATGVALADRGLEVFERQPANLATGFSGYAVKARLLSAEGRFAEAVAAAGRGVACFEAHGPDYRGFLSVLRTYHALALLGAGERARAAAALEMAWPDLRALGLRVNIADARVIAARLLLADDPSQTAGAEHELDLAEAEFRAAGAAAAVPWVLEERGNVRELAGDAAGARAWREKALGMYRELGAAAHVARMEGAGR